MFKNIENVTIDRGLPGTSSGMPSPTNDDTYTVAQLYDAVKKIARSDGGLKYSDSERNQYLFHYTKRNDGVAYQDCPFSPVTGSTEDGSDVIQTKPGVYFDGGRKRFHPYTAENIRGMDPIISIPLFSKSEALTATSEVRSMKWQQNRDRRLPRPRTAQNTAGRTVDLRSSSINLFWENNTGMIECQAESQEAKAVAQMQEQFHKLQDLFAEALADAGENFGKAEEQNNTALEEQQFANRMPPKTFTNGQNAKGVFSSNILIDLSDSNSEWWTGRYNHAILGMSKSDDTEFRQFFQEIQKRTKDMPEYGESEQEPITVNFTIRDGNGKEFTYRVRLDGFMHGVVLEKIDKRKWDANIRKNKQR